MISIAYLRLCKLEDCLTVLSFEIFQNRFFKYDLKISMSPFIQVSYYDYNLRPEIFPNMRILLS